MVHQYGQVLDQTRHGISSTGKDTRSVDLLLVKNHNEVAIIEALRLSSVDTTEIKKHVDKAVTNGDDPTYYDRLYGLAMNYKRMLDELRADKKSSPSTSQFYH